MRVPNKNSLKKKCKPAQTTLNFFQIYVENQYGHNQNLPCRMFFLVTKILQSQHAKEAQGGDAYAVHVVSKTP